MFQGSSSSRHSNRESCLRAGGGQQGRSARSRAVRGQEEVEWGRQVVRGEAGDERMQAARWQPSSVRGVTVLASWHKLGRRPGPASHLLRQV